MSQRNYYLVAAVVAASLLSLFGQSDGCPEASGWYYSSLTKMCYRGLFPQKLNYIAAQKKCNELRSNLFQFNKGDNKTIFDNLQTDLNRYTNTTEFIEESWIGLTDRAAVDKFVYLNGLQLSDIAPNTLISCPQSTPNCQRTHRCVYLNLNNRGSSNKQVFKGDCDNTLLPPICYGPVGGTDVFDTVPQLGADSVAVSATVLVLATCLSAAVKIGLY